MEDATVLIHVAPQRRSSFSLKRGPMRFCVLLVITVITLGASPSQSGKVTLQFKHKEGSSSSVKSTSKVHQSINIGGQEFTTTARTVVMLTSSVGNRDDGGRLPIQQTVDGLAVELTLPGGVHFEFDSANPVDNSDDRFRPLIESFKARIGSSHVIILGKNNAVVGVEGTEKILEKATPAAMEILRGELKHENLKRSAEQGYGILPSDPVSKGDTWIRTSTMRIGGGQTLKLETRFEYQGTTKRDAVELDRIGTTVISAAYLQDDDTRASFKITQGDLKVETSTGSILFDRAKGQPIASNSSTHIVGDVTLMANGMEFPAKLDLTLESTSLVEK
jgi:hypothetical protein